MDYSEKIFKILGIEPDEEFKIKEIPNCLYKINKKLNVKVATTDHNDFWLRAIDVLPALLNGTYTIEKIVKPITEEEKLAVTYAKTCGYKWIAKDKDGTVFAYTHKPEKKKIFWCNGNDSMNINIPVNFLSWKDNEPYYIGD